ncbi:TBC1 domain family member 23-like [Chelonus insularis]|uniref:TBC1 domain family member 23-like n=1 Tax=Chelonus insularis TaxID=460826 RepID=UPI001588D7D8|nr:TBC1 domain family member 23-like [Chelonus insularis]
MLGPVVNEHEEFDISDDESNLSSYLFNQKSLIDALKIPSDKDLLKLRIWDIYLDDSEEAQKLIYATNLFDLPEQSAIEEDCRRIIDALQIEEEDQESVLLNLKVIITIYCKSEGLKYKPDNGWIELLGVLILKGFSRFETYNLFKNMRDIYVPNIEAHGYLLRLLLLYHNPELCLFFDRNNVCLINSTHVWTNTLFAGVCNIPVATLIWDYIYNFEDTFFISFLCLAMIITFSEENKIMHVQSKQKKIETDIEAFPSSIDEKQIMEFLKLAASYELRTPSFFKQKYYPFIFGKRQDLDNELTDLCLPVSAQEVMRNVFVTSPVDEPKAIKFFVADCRPLEQFNNGHLPVGYFIDCDSIFELDAPDYVNILKKSQKFKDMFKSNEEDYPLSKHVTIMGNGFLEDNECVQVIIKDLLQSYIPYVSIIIGGYQAVHNYFREHVGQYLIDHNNRSCLACILNTSMEEEKDQLVELMETEKEEEPLGLSNRIRTNLTQRGREVNEKIMRWIRINPHLHKSLDSEKFETVSITDWVKNPNVVKLVECKEITKNNTYKSLLIITDCQLLLIREKRAFKKEGKLIVQCPIMSIGRISASKKNSNIVTFKLDKTNVDVTAPSDSFKLYIPGSQEVVKVIREIITSKW